METLSFRVQRRVVQPELPAAPPPHSRALLSHGRSQDFYGGVLSANEVDPLTVYINFEICIVYISRPEKSIINFNFVYEIH